MCFDTLNSNYQSRPITRYQTNKLQNSKTSRCDCVTLTKSKINFTLVKRYEILSVFTSSMIYNRASDPPPFIIEPNHQILLLFYRHASARHSFLQFERALFYPFQIFPSEIVYYLFHLPIHQILQREI